MSDTQFHVTADERAFLTELLETALKEARIEEHRTRTLSYREHIIRNEELIASVLRKLAGSTASKTPGAAAK